MTDLDVDAVLQRRVSTKLAAKYLGVSVRQVQQFIHAGLLDAADMRAEGAKRASFSVTVASVRRLLVAREFRAEERSE